MSEVKSKARYLTLFNRLMKVMLKGSEHMLVVYHSSYYGLGCFLALLFILKYSYGIDYNALLYAFPFFLLFSISFMIFIILALKHIRFLSFKGQINLLVVHKYSGIITWVLIIFQLIVSAILYSPTFSIESCTSSKTCSLFIQESAYFSLFAVYTGLLPRIFADEEEICRTSLLILRSNEYLKKMRYVYDIRKLLILTTSNIKTYVTRLLGASKISVFNLKNVRDYFSTIVYILELKSRQNYKQRMQLNEWINELQELLFQGELDMIERRRMLLNHFIRFGNEFKEALQEVRSLGIVYRDIWDEIGRIIGSRLLIMIASSLIINWILSYWKIV